MVRLKMIFIFLLGLFISWQGCAQNFKAQLLGGLNVAQVDGDSYSGYNQPGIIGGFAILREKGEVYNYGFELTYSQKGSHKKTTEDDPLLFKLRYSYLCLPIFVDIKKLGKSMDQVRLRIGLSNNFNIQSKVDYGYGWNDNTIKRHELSGIFGVGYQMNKEIGFMLRAENSIITIGTPPPSRSQNYRIGRGLYNRMFSFIFTYNLQ